MKNSTPLRQAAIFGGSFDPPHLGHLRIVQEALRQLPIEKLFVVPAKISPFKNHHAAPAKLRYRWLQKAMAFDPRIEVSDLEIRRAGPSYTVDTVSRLGRDFDTIYLIIGADNLAGLKRWHRFDDLDRMVRWVVASREGTTIPEGYLRLDVEEPVSSTALRAHPDPDAIPAPIRREVVDFYTSQNQEGE